MKNQLRINTTDPNYLYFMLSLLFMLLLPPLAPIFSNGFILLDITYGLVLIMGVIYAGNNWKDFSFLGLIASLVFVFFIYDQYNLYFSILNAMLTFIFFSLVFYKILRHILLRPIRVNEIYACITGYLILGVMAAPIFYLIEQSFEIAFLLPEQPQFYDFIYFSFITLTSVGFGDISPVHPFAKGVTIVVSIVGQLYLTILIAIIIGKFFANEKLSI